MCGASGYLLTVDVEGVELKVCKNCSKYGTQKKSSLSQRPSSSFRQSQKLDKPQFKVVNNYSKLLLQSRQDKGMSQEDFAKFINERESVVAKWESGSLKPRVDIARKVGKSLGIILTEKEVEAKPFEIQRSKADGMTLGDFIKKPRKKT